MYVSDDDTSLTKLNATTEYTRIDRNMPLCLHVPKVRVESERPDALIVRYEVCVIVISERQSEDTRKRSCVGHEVRIPATRDHEITYSKHKSEDEICEV